MALKLGAVVSDEHGTRYQVISKAAPSGYWAQRLMATDAPMLRSPGASAFVRIREIRREVAGKVEVLT